MVGFITNGWVIAVAFFLAALALAHIVQRIMPVDVHAPGTSVIDTLRDYSLMSREELKIIAGSPELERGWGAVVAGNAKTARAEFEAASGSSCEAVAALAQVALVQHSTADAGQIVATCNRLAERFRASPEAAVRAGGIHALIVASQQPGAGLEALSEAARRADDDPELRVTAADAHMEIARWWAKRYKEAPGNADRAIDEYNVVISRAADTNEPALQTIVQFAHNEKTQLLIHHLHEETIDTPALPGDPDAILRWALAKGRQQDRISSEQAIATTLPPDAPAILRLAVAQAWLTHGRLLYERDDTTEGAVEALTELGRLFRNDSSPQVQAIVRQGRELDEIARRMHRHGGPYGWTRVDPHADIRIPLLRYEGRVWGWKMWPLSAALVLILALLGLWPVSRRILDTVNGISDAREQALDTESTVIFAVAATAMALRWLVLNTRSLLHGKSAQWRQLGIGLVLALALAGLIFVGGRITGLFG